MNEKLRLKRNKLLKEKKMIDKKLNLLKENKERETEFDQLLSRNWGKLVKRIQNRFPNLKELFSKWTYVRGSLKFKKNPTEVEEYKIRINTARTFIMPRHIGVDKIEKIFYSTKNNSLFLKEIYVQYCDWNSSSCNYVSIVHSVELNLDTEEWIIVFKDFEEN